MSGVIVGIAGVALAAYYVPPLLRRHRIRKIHNVYHYIEYNLHGDEYSTMDNGPVNGFIAEAVIDRVESFGGHITHHYQRQNVELVQEEIDSRYARQQRELKIINSKARK